MADEVVYKTRDELPTDEIQIWTPEAIAKFEQLRSEGKGPVEIFRELLKDRTEKGYQNIQYSFRYNQVLLRWREREKEEKEQLRRKTG